MALRMSHDQKEVCIEFVRAKGTLKAGATAAGVTYQTLWNEMKRSPIFAKRVEQAHFDGKNEIGDKAIQAIKDISSEQNKDMRSRLTANIVLANWAVPGFRGQTQVSGKIEHNHNIRVKSAIPRPRYDDLSTGDEPKELTGASYKVLPEASDVMETIHRIAKPKPIRKEAKVKNG